MNRLVIRLTTAIVTATALAAGETTTEAVSRRPSLIVVLVVDQMRADYLDRFERDWTAGLRRLVDDGAWFRLAAYPYLHTVTCAGHATVATGAFPATHGAALNGWWDRETAQLVTCTDDPTVATVGYESTAGRGHSAWRLRVPTLADELRAQLPVAPRIVTQSLKARSAIMLAGQRGDAVSWFDDGQTWATSTAFTPTPVPFLQAFFDANPVAADYGTSWTRTLAAAQYVFPESAVGKTPGQGWTTDWPHRLESPSGTPDRTFRLRWSHSPYSDEYLSRLALHAVDTLGLGQGEGTDYLAISFSALDLAGHDFGPRSHEVQDVLARLDRTIGRVLDHLDRTVGSGEYVVALTADHGVAPVPERMVDLDIDAGRILPNDGAARIEESLTGHLQGGPFVARVEYTDVYFAPGVYDRLLADPSAMQAVIGALRATPGIARVYRGDRLRERPLTDDPVAMAAARSYDPERSGDLIVIPKDHWFTSNNAATHGTAHDYNTRVPVILMGKGIWPGEYLTPATPADIAPTLAFLTGITLAQAEGRVLVEAVAPPPRAADSANPR